MKHLFKTLLLLSLFICSPSFAQNAALLPNAVQQFFDNNGNPLSSGYVYTYEPGTLTLKTTWRDANQTTPNTNPIRLDAGGKAIIYGEGTYRQIVKDRNGNTIWDAVTAPGGGTSPTPSTVGDGNLVGTVLPWSGLIAPNQYVFAYGQEINRTDYPEFYIAITITQNINCNIGSPTLLVPDTTQIAVGTPVESSCVPINTTVVSKTSSTVIVNNNAVITAATTAKFFPWGNGNGTTTFNVPDYRGRVLAGRDNMGGTIASRLTASFFAVPGLGAVGGNQSFTIDQTNLPALTLATTIPAGQGTHTHNTVSTNPITSAPGGVGFANGSFATLGNDTIANATLPQMTGTTPLGGSNTAFSIVQPTVTLNYIVKIVPDASSAIATGVASIGGMVGVIACGDGLLCTGNVISVTGTGFSSLPKYSMGASRGIIDPNPEAVVPGTIGWPIVSQGPTAYPIFSDTLLNLSSVSTSTLISTGQFRLSGEVISTIASDQNNWTPTGTGTYSISSNVYVNGGASDRNVTGITGGVLGRRVTIVNNGTTNSITLVNQSASSIASNRFNFPANISIPPNGSITLGYDNTAQRWIALSNLLSNTGVTPGIYGNATNVPQITVGVDGRIISAVNVPIAVDSWLAQTFLSPGDFTPGVTTSLTLSSAPLNEEALQIMFDGIVQAHNTYSLASNVVTFSAAIPASVAVVEAQWATSASINNTRTLLTGNLTVYVAPTGSDVTGNGTFANPWQHTYFAYNTIKARYDLSNCVTVTIQLKDGTYDYGSQLTGSMIGQCRASNVVVQGNCVTPRNVVVAPITTNVSFASFFGAGYRLQCMMMDASNLIALYPAGQDILQVGNDAALELGDPTLKAAGIYDIIIGCTVGNVNAITVNARGLLTILGHIEHDVNHCQRSATGDISTGGTSITNVSSLVGVAPGMGIIAAGVPTSARISSIVGSTVNFVCASYISPCTNTATTVGVSIAFTNGGQAFMQLGQSSTAGFDTNGDPDFSTKIKLTGFPSYSAGFFYVNQSSNLYAQAITFENAANALGFCFVTKALSNIDTGLQGLGYIPCLNGVAATTPALARITNATAVAGSSTITVASANGIFVGSPISSYVTPTGSWTAGNPTITVSSTAGIAVGNRVMAGVDGILGGATVTAVNAGVSIDVGGCSGVGTQCVGGYPTYETRGPATIIVTGYCIPNNTVVTAISGTTLTLSQPVSSNGVCTGTFQIIAQAAQVTPWYGALYD